MSRYSTDTAWRRMALVGALTACLAACSGGAKRTEATGEEPVYPADATARYARALGFMDAGDDARAIAELEQITSAYPEYAGPHVNLGIIHQRNGRPDAAMSALQRALEVCSSCAAAYNQLGILQRQQGRFADAEQAYLAAIEADPEYALAYFNLGVLYDLYRGRPDLALQYYEAYQARRRPAAEDRKDIVDTWIIDLQRRVGEPQKTAEVTG